MRHWSQLATRNWRVKRTRTVGVLLAIALGTAAVVWVTCCFESVRRTVMSWALQYVGDAQVTVESPLGKYDTLPGRLVTSIQELPEVDSINVRLVQRLRGIPLKRQTFEANRDELLKWSDRTPELDLHGLEPAEGLERKEYPIKEGRMFRPDEEFACVLDASFASDLRVGLGDVVLVWGGARPEPFELTIVGLMERRRVARLQKGLAALPLRTLQNINVKQGMVTSIEITLHDRTDKGVTAAADKIRGIVRSKHPNANVRSVKARIQQIEMAQGQQEFILVLLSCVAMLTALFIILSTLSMGMVERIAQLGLMRCIGLTRWQLAALVLIDVLPLGALGILIGVPIGLGLAALTVWIVPDYVGSLPVTWDDVRAAWSAGLREFFAFLWNALDRTGILLAAAAGLATTFVGALLPMAAAVRVTPLEAARPRARRGRRIWVAVVGVLAVVMLGLQYFVVMGAPPAWQPALAPVVGAVNRVLGTEIGVNGLQRAPSFIFMSTVGIVLLYVGYALLAPVVIWLVGNPATVVTAGLTGVRVRLLQDQIGHAVWRSAGICSGLMVGLSLIVGLVVFSESVRAGWQFPRQFPEAYIWSFEQINADVDGILRATPEVREFTRCNAMNVWVEEKPLFMEKVFLSVTWFMGIEPDSIFDMVRFQFLEGDEKEARRLLKQGGHVIVADDFARTRNKHLGDTVKVFVGSNPPKHFKIAGVVQSPALDIAAGYFQAHSEMNVVANGSVMGTNADMQKLFNVGGARLILMNLDLKPEPRPADWPPPWGTAAALEVGYEFYDESRSPDERWRAYCEARFLDELCRKLGCPTAYNGTARDLKDEIDRELTRVTRLLTAVPAVALLVAALGVANLMTANVTSRARQLAILRAVGATRGLLLRMVVGEALVLGLLGSALGLLLGLHLALNTTTMTERMWGFAAPLETPWGYVSAAVALTVGLCILAGIWPARHAARTNIVDALHVP